MGSPLAPVASAEQSIYDVNMIAHAVMVCLCTGMRASEPVRTSQTQMLSPCVSLSLIVVKPPANVPLSFAEWEAWLEGGLCAAPQPRAWTQH
jgi:hypothetical protein